MLSHKISTFVSEPKSDDFTRLALESFRHQCRRSDLLRRYCLEQGLVPEKISDWRDIPLIPSCVLDSHQLIAALTAETSQLQETNPVGLSELEAAVNETTFSSAVPASLAHPVILSLVPPLGEAPESHLGSLVEHSFSTFGGANSLRATGTAGLKTSEIRSWLGMSQRSGLPVIILTSMDTLQALLTSLNRFDLRFRLPPGSTVVAFEVTAALAHETSSMELIDRTGQWLGIPPENFVSEYRPEHLATPFYSKMGLGLGMNVYPLPHWTRVRIVHPETLEEVAPGDPGLISILDLANIDSAIHLLTEDLGVADKGSFRRLGHASPEELKARIGLAREMVGG